MNEETTPTDCETLKDWYTNCQRDLRDALDTLLQLREDVRGELLPAVNDLCDRLQKYQEK